MKPECPNQKVTNFHQKKKKGEEMEQCRRVLLHVFKSVQLVREGFHRVAEGGNLVFVEGKKLTEKREEARHISSQQEVGLKKEKIKRGKKKIDVKISQQQKRGG